MGKGAPFREFKLHIDSIDGRPQYVYPTGHTLTGSLHVVLNADVHVKAIRLLVRMGAAHFAHLLLCMQIRGKAVWSGKKTSKEMAVERVYFNRDMVLLERPPGQAQPGDFLWRKDHPYDLPWECPLPRSSPTSYEGPEGHVR